MVGPSFVGEVSSDGRYVTFINVAPASSFAQLFIHDRFSLQTELISVDSNGTPAAGQTDVSGGQISDDGRFVVFATNALNLHPAANGEFAIYLRDRLLGQTMLVSTPVMDQWPDGPSLHPVLSCDARYVAFSSAASNLVRADINSTYDVFLRDMLEGKTTCISIASNGEQGNFASAGPFISANGRFVGFSSSATNLDGSDTNGWADGFVRDRWTGVTKRVSLTWNHLELNAHSSVTGISDDGRLVGISTAATNVIEQPVSGDFATYIRERWKLGDVNRDGIVNVVDLLAIINAWGPCPAAPPPPALPIPCDADVTNDNIVNVADLLLIINNWG